MWGPDKNANEDFFGESTELSESESETPDSFEYLS